jgi:hypothetical protein
MTGDITITIEEAKNKALSKLDDNLLIRETDDDFDWNDDGNYVDGEPVTLFGIVSEMDHLNEEQATHVHDALCILFPEYGPDWV